MKRSKYAAIAAVTVIAFALAAQAQQPPGGAGNGGPGGGPAGAPGGGPGGGGFAPAQTDRYKSDLVKLGGNSADALQFVPVTLGSNPRVAVVTTYQPPAAELADRGYRTLLVRHLNRPATVASPFDGFDEISRGIAYMRTQPGIQKVVVAAWGGGSTTMMLYADVAERGPGTCQGKEVISPCTTAEVSGLSRPDGVILLDPSLGGAYKVLNIDAAYDGATRSRADLDIFSAANGYDDNSGTAMYSAQFRKKYFAAQSARNNQIVDQALARAKQLAPGQDEPFVVPGARTWPCLRTPRGRIRCSRPMARSRRSSSRRSGQQADRSAMKRSRRRSRRTTIRGTVKPYGNTWPTMQSAPRKITP